MPARSRRTRKPKIVNYRISAPGYQVAERETYTGVILTLNALLRRRVDLSQVIVEIREPRSRKTDRWVQHAATAVSR